MRDHDDEAATEHRSFASARVLRYCVYIVHKSFGLLDTSMFKYGSGSSTHACAPNPINHSLKTWLMANAQPHKHNVAIYSSACARCPAFPILIGLYTPKAIGAYRASRALARTCVRRMRTPIR